MTNRNIKNIALGALMVAALAAAPLAPAQARDWHHGGWGGHGGGWDHRGGHGGDSLFFGLLGATAALVTAPFVLAGDILAPPPAPVYAAPGYAQPAYAAPVYAAPAYGYYRPHRVVYAYPPAPAYYPQPVYGVYPGY